jgi:hypothetical protein
MNYSNAHTLLDASSRSKQLLGDIRAIKTGRATILLSRHQVVSLVQERNIFILAFSSYNKWKIAYSVDRVENYVEYVFTSIDTPQADLWTDQHRSQPFVSPSWKPQPGVMNPYIASGVAATLGVTEDVERPALLAGFPL